MIGKIKDQIDVIINGLLNESKDYEQLNTNYGKATARINEGIHKMKTAKVWTEDEINSIDDFAITQLNRKYYEMCAIIKSDIRENWTF